MALYYVSIQRGNDANNGTSPSTPWATITKAVGMVAAGDTVYIGAGTYRERPSLATSGSVGNIIYWLPDSMGEYVVGDNPGIVRVTGCDTNENSSSGAVWNSGFANHNTVGWMKSKLYVDGSSDTTTCSTGHTPTTRLFVNVVSIGFNGFSFGNCVHCVGIGGYHGFLGAASSVRNNCIAIGGYVGILDSLNIQNCISIGGGMGFFGTAAPINSIAIGGTFGFNAVTARNCLAFGSRYGFNGSSVNMTITNCRAIACEFGAYGTDTDNKLNITTFSAVWCRNNGRGTTHETGAVPTSKSVIYDLQLIAQALVPLLQTNLNDGDNTYGSETYDILGHARRLGSGNIDIGAIEHSLATLDFTNLKTVPPGIKIERAGMQRFTFWAEGGVEFTKSVWVKWSGYAGADKPQIITDGDNVTRTTTTAIGDGTAWEQISVSATPSADGEVVLYLYARDTAAAAVTYFSDIE